MPNDHEIPLFSGTEIEALEKSKSSLIKLLQAREGILFVGSGTSTRVGFPTWDALLGDLETLAGTVGTGFTPNPTLRAQDPYQYADYIKTHIQDAGEIDQYHAQLDRIFQPRNPNYHGFHQALVRLPFQGFVTTNYDTIISEAITSLEARGEIRFSVSEDTKNQVSKFLFSLNKSFGLPTKVAHLHGCYDNPRGIILSQQDYVKAYEAPRGIHQNVLWSLLATRRVVFVGFGMRDRYLMDLLKRASADLWRWDQPSHFNITSISTQNPTEAAEAKERAGVLRRNFGVETIFYERGADHSQLERLIEELNEKCGTAPKSAEIEPETVAPIIAAAPPHPAATAPEPRPPSGWIAANNVTMEALVSNED